MKEIKYNGKIYYETPIESQKVMEAVNIHMFRYYPIDRLFIASDFASRYFGIDKFFYIDRYGDGPDLVAEAYKEKDHAMYRRINEGADFVTANLRFKDEKYYKVSLAVVEKEDDGRPKVVAGIIEDFNENMQLTAFAQMLSDEYYSVFSVDFSKDKVVPYRMLKLIDDNYGDVILTDPSYVRTINMYIDSEVVPEEKEEMRICTSYEHLSKRFKKSKTYVHDYRILRDGRIVWIRLKAVNMSDGDVLTRAVIGFAEVSRERREQWQHLAYIDQITGGYNSNYFTEQLRKSNEHGYLVSMDIHDFKVVNSVCGIEKGDYILRSINSIIESSLDKNSFYGHLNADHFAMLLAVRTEEEVITVMERIMFAVDLFVKDENIPKISAYFGACKWFPGDRYQVKFSEANSAKHRIKNSNNEFYGFYRDKDIELAVEEKNMEDAFEDALKNDEFEIWYQPKYSPLEKSLTGAEALIRWRKPDVGLVPPGKFIPIFERNGMIRQLDEYVFTKVCKQQKEWLNVVGKTVPISINISRASLYYESVVDDYKKIVDNIGILPELVPIEITETAAVDNRDIKVLADRFFEAGFPLHIDDFGTGYSSLSTLNMMRFDTLKLDKSLVDYIGKYGGDRLLKHTVALAKDLGLHVTAEGVENENQVSFLRELECDNIQGFLFSRPLQRDFFTEKLKGEAVSDRYIYKKGQRYTYPMIVEKYRKKCENIGNTNVDESYTIEFIITGEGEGRFFVEMTEKNIQVFTHECLNRNICVTSSAEVLSDILEGNLSANEAREKGKLESEGDFDVIITFDNALKKEMEI